MSSGLQINRFSCDEGGFLNNDKDGGFCLFSDYNTLHESAQKLTGENMTLKAELIVAEKAILSEADIGLSHADEAATIKKQFNELKDELALVMEERDELLEQKERAEHYAREGN